MDTRLAVDIIMNMFSFTPIRLLVAFSLGVAYSISLSSAIAVDPSELKPLDHEDYDHWNRLSGQQLSRDGRWVHFKVTPGEGDATLKIRQTDGDRLYSVPRGTRPHFTPDSQHIVYLVEPDPEQLKKLRKQDTPDSELPKQRLEIVQLKSGQRVLIERVSRFTLPEESSEWIAYEIYEEPPSDLSAEQTGGQFNVEFEITESGVRRPEKPKEFRQPEEPSSIASTESKRAASPKTESKEEQPEGESKGENGQSESGEEESKPEKKEDHDPGSTLMLRHLPAGLEYRLPFVTEYRFDEAGEQLAYCTSTPEGERDGVHVFDLQERQVRPILAGLAHYARPAFTEDGRRLAVISDREDYVSEQPEWRLYLWQRGDQQATPIVAAGDEAIPEGWVIADAREPKFTEDGRRLLYQTRPKPEPDDSNEDKKDKDADDEDDEPKAKLDLWHWEDSTLQPEQLLQAERERNRSYLAVYDIRRERAMQLETRDIPSVAIDRRSPSNVALAVVPDKYEKMLSWDRQGYADWYLFDLNNGQHRVLAEKKRGRPSLSPDGKYITWWDGDERTWLALSTSRRRGGDGLENSIDLGIGIEFPLDDELHDTPSLPGPYGSPGWTPNDESILIYDRWDLWEVDPRDPENPVCLTDGWGRAEQVLLRRVQLDPEQRTVDLSQPHILSALVHRTKASGYYRLDPADPSGPQPPTRLIQLDESVSDLQKAEESDVVLFTRSTFRRCPDLWTSQLAFEKTRRLSDINPQQDDYRWGTAELTRWKSRDGQQLDGILYKPDGFDPEQKYPLMVYFYERNSDHLHRYYTSEPGRSIINFSFYVSRGYCLFVPDIPYKTGEPGPSAANAVLPGVEHIVEHGFIDPDRIGMQGHSWGGYQTAYLVTLTDMFACAESGAPVSNMTSAYGGIRWGTGLSRMFQYERTQSRIGDTLWEAPQKYIENSPLFSADKINTPLLILHNDEDTAVPWYQGIELFVALRRLEKPVWMLNYNNEPHWVMKPANRLDFAQRMQQFFDHHLQDEPLPVWMAEGIPAVDKGREFGLEYIRPNESEASEEPTESDAAVRASD